MVEVAEVFLPLDSADEEINSGKDDAAVPSWRPPSASASAFDCQIRRGGGRSLDQRLPSPDHGVSVPVVSPGRRFQISSDSDSEDDCLGEEGQLALDLFDRGSLMHENGAGGGREMDPFPDAGDPIGFGVFDALDEMGSDYLELELGLGLRFEEEEEEPQEGGNGDGMVDLEEGEGSDWGGDGFFVGRRGMVLESGGLGETSCSRDSKGLGIVGFGFDSDSDDEEVITAISPRSDRGNAPDRLADDVGLPLCWDCLRIEEDRRDPNEDFEWEEVDGRVDEREVLSLVIDADDDRSLVPDDSNAYLELDEEEQEDSVRNLDWEVLLAMNNLERNAPVEHEDSQSYLGEDHDDYVYASEYEILFGQFAENEAFSKGSPPAAKSVIDRLPSVVLTQVDVENNNTVCAVCKDEISMEEKAKQLPCWHHYHGDCILPWLRIRNTCPVCRYELPTDDPDYESWRAQRVGGDGAA